MRSGVLLLNVGTPKAHGYWAVKNYLEQFLMDKRIIDIPFLLRLLLVRGFITPFRAHESAKKYREIWQEEGSPLHVISARQVELVTQYLGNDFHVALAMRYGEPSIETQIRNLIDQGCEQLILAPLLPQYSSAASGSALEEAFACLKKLHHIPSIKTLSPFYREDFFIESQARKIAPYISSEKHVVISFHGLPHHHIARGHKDSPCHHSQACPQQGAPAFCYRAQSFETARLLSEKLKLKKEHYSVAFQSRLGRQRWIEPYLNDTLKTLRKNGVSQVVIVCPAFVTDCLETLHEIGIETKAIWERLGGKTLELVPCLNDDEIWLKGLSQKINALANV